MAEMLERIFHSSGKFYLLPSKMPAFHAILVTRNGVKPVTEKELLQAILHKLELTDAKLTATQDQILHLQKDVNSFKDDMTGFKEEMTSLKEELTSFKSETAANFKAVREEAQVNKNLLIAEIKH